MRNYGDLFASHSYLVLHVNKTRRVLCRVQYLIADVEKLFPVAQLLTAILHLPLKFRISEPSHFTAHNIDTMDRHF